jgi:colicin import membrane protein
LLDKRDPTRQAMTGAVLNSSASLGTTHGTAATLSQSELDAMRAKLASLWNVQPGTEHPEELFVTVRIRLGPDRMLVGSPLVISTGNSPRYQAAADAAVRAVLQGQPYKMLRDETYDQWKFMDIDFDPKQMFRS